MLKSPTKQFGEPCPSCPWPQDPEHPSWRMHICNLPPHPALCSAASVSCPHAGGSHSRSKEILCKSTGSQRRQDSGQAWQGVCVNSSEQADFAQRGRGQQKAFPGRQGRAVHFRSLASGRPSRTWCTWCKADKLKSQYFYLFGPSSRWLPNTQARRCTSVPLCIPPSPETRLHSVIFKPAPLKGTGFPIPALPELVSEGTVIVSFISIIINPENHR